MRTTLFYNLNKFFSRNLIKTSTFFEQNCFKRNLNQNSIKNESFQAYIQSKIKMKGPITVAEYMKEALGNPKWVGEIVIDISHTKKKIYFLNHLPFLRDIT